MLITKLVIAGVLSFWWSSVVVRYGRMEDWEYKSIALVSMIGGGAIGLIIGLFL